MLENIILGILQGVFEWLPVSSEGVFVLVNVHILQNGSSLETILQKVLFLHLGTALAVLVYFKKDTLHIFNTFIKYEKAKLEYKNIQKFLIISTIISGLIGFLFLKLAVEKINQIADFSQILTLLIGILLFITGILQIKIRKGGFRQAENLTKKDGIFLGIVQGIATLPGLSRSGLTMAGLFLSKFKKQEALRLSFLMSVPIVLVGNFILNFKNLFFSLESLVGLLFSFVFGYLTIAFLLRLVKKVNFGYLVLGFGFLMIFLGFVL